MGNIFRGLLSFIMQKNTFNNLRLICFTVVLITIVIASAFLVGTFYPNKWTTLNIQKDFHKKEVKEVIYLGLVQPEFEYTDKASFITATGKCIDYLNFTTDRLSRVPTSMIIAMAGVESGWGTSRFANEGNALFGVRTWDETVPQIKPLDLPNADFGVKKYKTKCDSVKDMVRILNSHPAYEKFRIERQKQLETGKWNYRPLMMGMTAWSTNPDYAEIILQTIVDNKLP